MIPPPLEAVKRKDDWLREVQKTVEAEWKPKMIKVTYRIHNPEVEQQRKFFNGPVVEYFLIQNREMIEGRPATQEKQRYREAILDDVLGYDIELIDRKVRRRKSTSEFTETQEWHDFLETVRETLFEPNGYEFPESEAFWKLSAEIGHDKAKEAIIDKLQERMAKRIQKIE